MKLPDKNKTGVGTAGLTGVSLMILHITGHLTGWAWPVLYIFLILAGIGQEQSTRSKE